MIGKDILTEEITILFVVEGSAINRGMNTGLENLAWGLAEQGIEVHILCGGKPNTNHGYRIPENVKYHFTGKKWKNPLNVKQLYKQILEKYNIDVVIGWIINIATLAAITKNKNVIFIPNQGQLAPSSIYVKYLKLVLKRRISFFDAIQIMYYIAKFPTIPKKIISISESVQKSCIRTYSLDPNKCMVIPRGVDTSLFKYKEREKLNEKPILLFAGNIKPPKGITDLIDSLNYIDKPVKVILCGKGEPEYISFLQTKVESYKIGHELIFAGPQSQEELSRIYRECDMFVFPSHSEGLGKALIEAMSCGCPIICSDIDTFKEVIIHEENGLMAKVNSPESLAKCIVKYLDDPYLLKKCSINARKTIEEHYSKQVEVDRWLQLLESEKTSG